MKSELKRSLNTNVKRKKRLSGEQWQLMSMALPAALVVFIFSYLPIGGLVLAFKDYKYNKGILGSDFVGLKNFMFFFRSNDFFTVTRNTLLYNFMFIVVGLIVSVSLAIMLSNITKRISIKIYQTSIFLPYFLSWVVVAYMSLTFLDYNHGLINNLMKAMGKTPISFYSELKYWPFILLFFNLWKGMGYSTLIYYACILGIDESLYEAARLDGCSNLKLLRHITIPMLVPTIILLSILSIGRIFYSDFGLFFQLTHNVGTLMPVTDVIDTYIYRTLRITGDVGISAAVGFIQSIVGFVLVLGTNLVVRRINEENSLY